MRCPRAIPTQSSILLLLLLMGCSTHEFTVIELGAADSEEARSFYDEIPQAMCDWYARCGRLEQDADGLEECAREIRLEIQASLHREGSLCPGALAYFNENRVALTACLSSNTQSCDRDDFDLFCPEASSVEATELCRDNTRNEPATSLTLTDFINDFSGAVCAYYARCGHIPESMLQACESDARRELVTEDGCQQAGLDYLESNASSFSACLNHADAPCIDSDDLEQLCPPFEGLISRCTGSSAPEDEMNAGPDDEMNMSHDDQCQSNSDCRSRQICRSGQCQRVDCTNDAHCSGCRRCISNRCRSCGTGPFGCYC